MNLLTLQIAKENATIMFDKPDEWLANLSPGEARTFIQEQGKRTLEVIKAYESLSKSRRRIERT